MLKRPSTLLRKTLSRNNLSQLWGNLREAVAGSEQDFTSIHLGKAIFLLSIPMILEMVMESVFAVVDIFFVSKLGAAAVAAVGITEALLSLVYAIGMGLSTGTTALIARFTGAKQTGKAAESAVQAIIAGVAISLLFAVPGIIWSEAILAAMGADTETIAIGKNYIAIMLGGNVTIILLFVINAIFRSSGDASVAMRVLWLANLLNIFLDPCLIFGLGPFPELGLTGAAIATTFGRGAAVVYQVVLLYKGRKRLTIKQKHIKLNGQLMKRFFLLSAGGIGQSLIATLSWVGLMRIVSSFGQEVTAAYAIAIRIVIFALLPSWGISNAAATLTGQNLGAKKPGRAERATWSTGLINTVFLSLIGVFILVNARSLLSFFIDEAEVINHGIICLQFFSYGFVFYGMGMVVIQALNGAGDTRTPVIINIICFWIIEIPLAYFLAYHSPLNERGIYLSVVLSESLMTVIGIMVFRRGKWKKLGDDIS